jgi:Fur family transcriptional regulator, ferric uptake regulator
MDRSARTRWLDHSQLVLRGAGLRASAGRSAVVELLGRQTCLLSAQDISDQLRAEGSRGSSATVYRALETLHELGLVRRFDSDGVARYEPVDPSGDHHHHIVMEESGDVVPFEDAELERAIEGLGERLGMVVTSHDVILRARRS